MTTTVVKWMAHDPLTTRVRNSLPRDVASKLMVVNYLGNNQAGVVFHNRDTNHQHTSILHAAEVGTTLSDEAIAWLCLECP